VISECVCRKYSCTWMPTGATLKFGTQEFNSSKALLTIEPRIRCRFMPTDTFN
jgi:hypothetical protein